MEDVPGEDLKTYAFKGTTGRAGLELQLRLRCCRARPAARSTGSIRPGSAVTAVKGRRMPRQGQNLDTSLDIDLQLAADQAIGKTRTLKGAVVALDVRTGEVLVLPASPTMT